MNGFAAAICAALALSGCASEGVDRAGTSGIATGAGIAAGARGGVGREAGALTGSGHRANYTVSCELASVGGREELRAVMVFDGAGPIRLNQQASALYCGLAGATPSRPRI